MTHRAGPEALVALLNEYFEGMAQIVINHGGIVDKLVGDAVHALFNTPIDLADHPVKAVHCAIAIRAWTEVYRQTPQAVEIGLGRTRIGVETARRCRWRRRHPGQARLHGVRRRGEFRGAARGGQQGTWFGDLHRAEDGILLPAGFVAPDRHHPASRLY
jgi:class 3 adenylate cyclase